MKQTLLVLSLALLPVMAMANTSPIECMRDTKRPNLAKVLTQEQAVRLCAGSKGFNATIDCFRDAIRTNGLNLDVETAIELCRER